MTFRLSIPGRDDFKTSPAANPAIPLIQTEPISRLAALAGLRDSIEASRLTAELLAAAMHRCDSFNDDEAAREEMRRDCMALPSRLQGDLLEHFHVNHGNRSAP